RFCKVFSWTARRSRRRRPDASLQSGFLQARQPVGQNVRRYPLLRPGQQLAEVTAVAEHQVADDDQAPAIPSASRVRLIGQPERGAFMRTPRTNCDMKSVDLAYDRLQNAIRTARMCRVRKGSGMAKLVFGMNQSLDGYVDHMAFAPSPTLFRHFIEEAQGQAGSVYGRQMYEVMRYWDDDHPEWDAEEHAFAAAWRNQPKWVVSRSLKSVGPNARLVEDGLEAAIRELKAERDGEIEVAGPSLAHSLTELGLIDEYRIYLHPVVLGHGKPYFAGPRPPLRLMANDRIGEDVIRLAYVPA
ncbi:MAG TPA: dihydrofolate reductase family protein, partial [Vicinamibacterales bacterium]|nr:dihydrofolate reductase family protein [Vicinamibacterales bacterium]